MRSVWPRVALLVLLAGAMATPASANPTSNKPALFRVGAAKADITPSPAMIASGRFYLGGYGYGPAPSHRWYGWVTR